MAIPIYFVIVLVALVGYLLFLLKLSKTQQTITETCPKCNQPLLKTVKPEPPLLIELRCINPNCPFSSHKQEGGE